MVIINILFSVKQVVFSMGVLLYMNMPSRWTNAMSALQLSEAVCIYAYKLRKIFESFPTKLYVYHWTNIAPFCTMLPTTHTFNLTRKKYECTNNCISWILTARMCVRVWVWVVKCKHVWVSKPRMLKFKWLNINFVWKQNILPVLHIHRYGWVYPLIKQNFQIQRVLLVAFYVYKVRWQWC